MVKHESDYSYIRPTRFKKYSDRLIPFVLFMGAFALYIKTMAPSIFWGSSSVFAANNNILGIAESPSYPLYTLMGRIFCLIPGFTPAFSSNLMSAFFAAISVMLFYMIVKHFLEISAISNEAYKKVLAHRKLLAERPDLRQEHKDDLDLSPKLPENIIPNLAVTALFAVTMPVWLMAVRAEVYSLQMAITMAALYFVLRGVRNEERQQSFYIGIWIYTLSFANHPLLALALVPAFTYLLFLNGYTSGSKIGAISAPILFLILAFSSYLYIPFRVNFNPALHWDASAGSGSFWAPLVHIWDSFRFANLETGSVYLLKLKKIAQFMAGQIGWPLFCLWIAGFYGLFKIVRKKAVFFLLAILGNLMLVLWLVDFKPGDYNSLNYSALLLGLALIVSVIGIIYMLRLSPLPGRLSLVYSVLIVGFIYNAVDSNYVRADISQANAAEIMCDEIFNEIKPGSIIIVNDEILMAPLKYRIRADSTIINTKIISSGLISNVNYQRYLLHNYPGLIFPDNFGKTQIKDSQKAIQQICRENPHNDIYVQLAVPGINYKEIEPSGILFKYIGTGKKPKKEWAFYNQHLALIDKMLAGNPHEINTVVFTAHWMFDLGEYCDYYGRLEISRELYKRALMIDSKSIELRQKLAINLARKKKYKEALKYIAEILDIESQNTVALEIGRQIVKAIEKRDLALSQ